MEISLILYTPFSKKLFQNPFSQKIIKEALSTTFITGMAQGQLPLSNYRNFLEQNAAYFKHVADVYRLAAIKMEIQKKKNFMLIFIGNSPQKKLSGKGQVGTALKAYMDFLSNVSPEHLALAMLSCSVLYPELARIKVQIQKVTCTRKISFTKTGVMMKAQRKSLLMKLKTSPNREPF